MMRKKYFIESPAPTPNGKLHLGHIAGPYLSADIFTRMQKLNGNEAFFVCDIDRNQSYVSLGALKSGMDRQGFLQNNISSIESTFSKYDIGFDLFNMGQTEDQIKFIVDFITQLLDTKHVVNEEVEFYFDEVHQKFLVEGFISGKCPKCLKNVKGGTCETCGYYNFSTDIINPFSTLEPSIRIIKKKCKIYVLYGEHFRSNLLDILDKSHIDSATKEFLFELLSKVAMRFPLTLPLDNGISINDKKTRLNPYFEVLCSTYYLKNIAKQSMNCNDIEELDHICFTGIDNAFYFVIICNLVRLCLELDDYPEAYFVNRYYSLNNDKFSTSRNNAVWADEITEEFDINVLRIFFALTYPGLKNYYFEYNAIRELKSQLEKCDWINSIDLLGSSPSSLNNEIPSKFSSVNIAKSFLAELKGKKIGHNNLLFYIEILCPSLFKKLMRRFGATFQVEKNASNSFKNEYGVKVNRLIFLDENNFSSSVVIVEVGKCIKKHRHNNLDELFYIIQGAGLIELEDSEQIVHEGDYVYIPGGMLHGVKQTADVDLKFISIAWHNKERVLS